MSFAARLKKSLSQLPYTKKKSGSLSLFLMIKLYNSLIAVSIFGALDTNSSLMPVKFTINSLIGSFGFTNVEYVLPFSAIQPIPIILSLN